MRLAETASRENMPAQLAHQSAQLANQLATMLLDNPAFAAPAETEAARAAAEDEDGEGEEFFAQPEETREEQENLKMLAHDDRWLMHLAEGLEKPSPWLLWAIREGDRSCLEELD